SEPMAVQTRVRFIISVICTNPRFKAPTWYACAPLSVTSPVANERVPSLSLSRLMVKALRVPSSSVLGTRNSPRPRVPAGAPSGRARVRIRSAETLEQNHLSPHSSHPGVGALSGASSSPGCAAPQADHPGDDEAPFKSFASSFEDWA